MKRCKKTKLPFELRCLLVAILLLGSLSSPAAAYIYSGGDWGGEDLSLLDGDVLSGEFFNIGSLIISDGVTISGRGGDLSLSAGSVFIEGALYGNKLQPGKLSLVSSTGLTMNGSLRYWQEISLDGQGGGITIGVGSSVSAGEVIFGIDGGRSIGDGTIAAGITLIAGGTDSFIRENIYRLDHQIPNIRFIDETLLAGLAKARVGSSLTMVSADPTPIPLPSAAFLMAPGLFALWGLRRKA